ncbi:MULTISPECIES: MotA/TolQ/ExbB proton channel family protein [Paraburkholderia]|uniref:MotA/TolQ/ExbB proton channel family protein n=1 Tax=Paraburkholderia TaxID=1822464 RepID=UPI002AB268E8|nr:MULTISPECIES: MotA/TolQ/ExbB proton channel family protein [Paraburkholderia]
MKTQLLEVLWRGDAISHAIALVLIGMSVLSWAVVLYKGVELAANTRLSAIVQKRFWQEDSLDKGSVLLGGANASNIYQKLVDAAIHAKDRHSGTNLEEVLSPDEWLQRCMVVAMEEQMARMSSGLGFLASIGSTAPFIGLFGTVWGIYHALMAIGATGRANLSQVAGPVGESLVMTALGLFVAIPAVLAYNALTRGNRGLMSRLARFRHELIAYIMSASRDTKSENHEKRAERRNNEQRKPPTLVAEGN